MAIKKNIKLVGMKEIKDYLQVSEHTVLKWHRECDLPIKKASGIWVGAKNKIDEWFQGYSCNYL